MDDLLNEFLTETAESIDVVDVELVMLEQDPNNKSVLDNIFRLVHTIKGTCGFLGLPRLESVAHSAENVLGKFRDGEIEVTPDAVTLILASLDRIKEILAGLEATEEEPQGDDSEIISQLNAMAEGNAAPTAASPVEEAPKVEEPVEQEITSSLGSVPGEVSLEELEAAFQAAPGPDDEDDAPAAENKDENAAETLLDKLGGPEAINVVVHLFFNRLKGEATLKSALSNVDLKEDKAQVEAFFVNAFSGEGSTDGAETAFTGLVKAGLNADQFAASVTALKSVMEEVGTAQHIIDEVGFFYESLAEKIVTKTAKAEEPKKEKAAATKTNDTPVSNQSIRVNVNVLEDLMTMVSELVLTRNQLMQIARRSGDSEFTVPLQSLSQCTTELQEGVMKTRMQPIGNAWAKLPRIVRDLQMELGKKIDLQMLGADTELDRQVLELIKDPLTHMVRNSADHGIEMPDTRAANGKKEMGTIRLNAFHEGGHIIIEINDDGAGLPVEKLKAKALKNEICTEEELAEMSDHQIQKFIFHAGFSTAEKVTSVSGRGVGMDVVRSNIEKIGGTVDLKSVEGKGTTFSIKIPLTLAIVSALIVSCKEERFAVPQISVLELVRASDDSEHSIEYINDTPVLRLRDRLLPLVYLEKILGFGSDEEEDKREAFVIVTQVGTFTFGIVVDQVYDTEEIVVKPVAPILRDLSIYSGNTILGDGSVIMILDPNGIASETSNSLTDVSDHKVDDQDMDMARRMNNEKEAILLFQAGEDGAQRAVPLSLVARLEEIDVAEIETSDGKPVVQYRGALMPLIKLNNDYDLKTEGRQPVLVFADGDRSMGLAVDQIVDILEDSINIELSSEIKGQIGTSVINGKATEVIDVAYYIEKAFGSLGNSISGAEEGSANQKSNILLVDDSTFFLNMMRPLLNAAGYNVTVVSNAEEALMLRENGYDFDLIVSDIEMPEMDGFSFVEKIREEGAWQSKPVLALSSHADPQSFERGRDVGFTDFVAKADRDLLLETINEQIGSKHKNFAA